MNQYTWASPLAAALHEINVQNLPKRIAAAERAISDRLASRERLDSEERMRIQDAQNALGDLRREIH